MIKNITLLICLLFISIGIKAQAPQIKFLGAKTASASGQNNISNIQWTIPEGRNRAIIISLIFERDHRTDIGKNWPINIPSNLTYSQALQGTIDNNPNLIVPVIKIGNKSFNKNDWKSAAGNFSSLNAPNSSNTPEYAYLSSMYYSFTLVEGMDGFPTGTVTFDFSGVKTANNSADEMLISIEVFENVSRTSDFKNVGSAFLNPTGGGNAAGESDTNELTFSITPPTSVPTGRTVSEVGYRASGTFTQSGITKSISSTSTPNLWQEISNVEIANNNGTTPAKPTSWSANTFPDNEHDGISLASALLVGPNPNIKITRNSSTRITTFRGRTVSLLPVATPSLSGTVYRDTNGSTNIDGTPTNAGGTYINVIDPDTDFVIYTTTVNSSGTFTIPQGYLQENITYTFQLTKNPGVIGELPPATELDGGYTYIGESSGSTGNDGTADGLLLLEVSTSNITGVRFGVNICNAGNIAPAVQNLSYTCGVNGINLASAILSTTPSNAVVRWYTTNNTSSTPLTTAQISNAQSGTYYAFYYDAVAGCYSPVSSPVNVTQICAVNDTYSVTATQAATGISFNNTVLENDSYNNATPTLGSVLLQVVTGATSIGGGPIPTLHPVTAEVNVPAGTPAGTYTIRYRICDFSGGPCSEADVTITVANPEYCFARPIVDNGKKINVKHGITALARAQSNGTDWPTVRQSAWTVLEAKTKGFVVNRVAFNSNNIPVGIPSSNFVAGMMVYDSTNNCLKIYNGSIWSCFSTPACP